MRIMSVCTPREHDWRCSTLPLPLALASRPTSGPEFRVDIYFLGNYIYSAIKAARESLPFLHLESLVIFSQSCLFERSLTQSVPEPAMSFLRPTVRPVFPSPAHNRRSATLSTRWLSPFFRMRSAR